MVAEENALSKARMKNSVSALGEIYNYTIQNYSR
jgi:hypothetical protein